MESSYSGDWTEPITSQHITTVDMQQVFNGRWESLTEKGHADCDSLLCSDILTPLTALGVPFDIDDHKGPIIQDKITSLDQVGGFYLHCAHF